MVRIEEFTGTSWCGVGRPPFERAWLANAFVAKAVFGLATTAGLVERLTIDRVLRRICGFPLCKKLPSEATFSRAFDEFAESGLGQRVHEALVKEHLGDQLIGHLSRDGTAIGAREHPSRKETSAVTAAATAQSTLFPAEESPAEATAPEIQAPTSTRGRPRRGEARPAAKASPIQRQRGQILAQMLDEIPTACDRGTKCNAQGYKNSWSGYKLYLDTADCGVPIAVLLSSASMHDSMAAIPLSLISAERVAKDASKNNLNNASYLSLFRGISR